MAAAGSASVEGSLLDSTISKLASAVDQLSRTVGHDSGRTVASTGHKQPNKTHFAAAGIHECDEGDPEDGVLTDVIGLSSIGSKLKHANENIQDFPNPKRRPYL